MTVQLKSIGVDAGQSLREYVSKRIGHSLAHWTKRLRVAVVRLSDANGSKGGEDKVCSIEIRGAMGPDIVVKGVSSDFFVAVDIAVRRAERAVQRAFGRL